VKVSRSKLEEIIRETLEQIPAYFQKKIENLDFTLEEEPSPELRKNLGLKSGELLMGVYQGTPNPRRGFGYGNALPDKITLFHRALEAYCPDEDCLRQEVYEVLVHEIGHYFGFGEEELRRLRPPHAYKRRIPKK